MFIALYWRANCLLEMASEFQIFLQWRYGVRMSIHPSNQALVPFIISVAGKIHIHCKTKWFKIFLNLLLRLKTSTTRIKKVSDDGRVLLKGKHSHQFVWIKAKNFSLHYGNEFKVKTKVHLHWTLRPDTAINTGFLGEKGLSFPIKSTFL